MLHMISGQRRVGWNRENNWIRYRNHSHTTGLAGMRTKSPMVFCLVLDCFAAVAAPPLRRPCFLFLFTGFLSWSTPGSNFPLSRQVLNVALVVQGKKGMNE